MKRLNMTTRNHPPRLGQAISELSKSEGSPCINCLVDSACRKSFVDKSACYEFAEFIQNILNERGKALDEDQN